MRIHRNVAEGDRGFVEDLGKRIEAAKEEARELIRDLRESLGKGVLRNER